MATTQQRETARRKARQREALRAVRPKFIMRDGRQVPVRSFSHLSERAKQIVVEQFNAGARDGKTPRA
jgi:hypothetical protein